MATAPPPELGRGVVVADGAAPPPAWDSAERVRVGPEELAEPAKVVDLLHRAWAERRPVVVELAVDAALLRAPEVSTVPPYALDPTFDFLRERLQFLVWANTYDARAGDPVWWHGRKAARLWSDKGVREAGPADLTLASGASLYIDGGPSLPPALADGTAVIHRWDAEAGSMVPARHDPPSAELAPDQLAAVAHHSGPARVIAPAGSGKTRVLTERLRHLVVDRAADPGTVTALAFNKKAAEELKTRGGDFLSSAGPHIRTLNSLALAICTGPGTAGRSALRVLEEPDVRALIERLFEIRHQQNTDSVAPYLEALSTIRLGLVPPAAAESLHPDAVGIGAGFDRYRQALADAGAVDFDEQIYRAIEILLTDPAARLAARRRARHLLVDEFQDLNPAHLLLLRLLAGPALDCFGVGDDDQVIYGYAGATPAFLIDFPTSFPGAAAYALEVNYRCPPAIVDAARHLLSYNHRRLEKTIRTPDAVALPDGPAALVVRPAPAEELAAAAIDILGRWRDGGTALDDMAVLARVNSTLLPVQVACAETGIPCHGPLTVQVLKRTGIRTALAYLRIGLDPGRIDRQDVVETIRRPSRRIARNVVEMLTRSSTTSLAEIRRLSERLSGGDVDKVASYADDLETVVRATRTSAGAALRAIRLEVRLGDALDLLDSSRNEADRSTHADDLVALESAAALHPDAATFEAWLGDSLGRCPPDGPAVLLSTVHKIKGREWPRVVVFGASRGSFPHRLAQDIEEERRIFHVALTRARTELVVLADAEAPSLFVAELDGSRPHTAAPAPGSDRRTRPSAARTRVAGPTVTAEIGLDVELGGTRGEIVELTSTGAVLAVGRARVPVAYGTDVIVAGRTVALTAPGKAVATLDPADEAVFEALREWRRGVSGRDKVPAYVVLNDEHLRAVAARRPTSLGELLDCPGIGPTKLDRYGDEILSVLEPFAGP